MSLTKVSFSMIDGAWFNVLDYGATGDGVTDDAPAIEAASLAAYTAGGGVLFFPKGTYLLATLSSDPNANNSYITLRDNVSLIGEGIGISVLKVASGQNALYYSQNKPNISATKQTTLLKNVTVRGITFDWNGANNLLNSGAARRNNASIATLYGAENLFIEENEFKETPGNQCVYILNNLNIATVPGRNVHVRKNVFMNNGEGLAGNYNTDHTSVYLQNEYSFVVNNVFDTDQGFVKGSAYELHGSHSQGMGNLINKYGNGCYVSSDISDVEDFLIMGDSCTNMDVFFSMSTKTNHSVNNVRFIGNSYQQQPVPTNYGLPAIYCCFNDTNPGLSDSVQIIGNTFIGANSSLYRCLQLTNIGDFVFRDNVVKNFNDSVNGYAIKSRNTTYSSGLIAQNIVIDNNVFENVYLPIYMDPTTQGVDYISIRNNQITNSAGFTYAIGLIFNAGEGVISGNDVYGYTYDVSLSGANTIKNQEVFGSATYDPPSLADGAGVTTTVAATGATLGMLASASFSLDLQGITVTAWVSAANTVSVRFQNESGGTVDLASGTLKVIAYSV